jgi:hypothetical protein
MPLVHGRSLAMSMRLDDGATQRRRLLQDLERQWLEAWGQIGQAEVPLRAAADPAGAVPAPRVTVPPHQAPTSAGAPQASTQASLPSREASSHSDPLRDGDPPGPAQRERVEPVLAHRDVAAGEAAAAASGPEAGVPAGPAQAIRTDSWTPPLHAMPSPSGSVAGLNHGPAGADDGALQPPAAGEALERLAGNLPAVAFRKGGPVQMPVSQPPPSALLNQMSAMPAAQASPLERASAEEQAIPASPPRPASAFAQTLSQGPRHLMLRELNEHEVLASMRDALLTPGESAVAAQGLVRALMQAGYARVQVFVNGRQHEQAAEGDANLKTGPRQAAETPTSSSKNGVLHGR